MIPQGLYRYPDWCARVTLPHDVLSSDTVDETHLLHGLGSDESAVMIAPQYATPLPISRLFDAMSRAFSQQVRCASGRCETPILPRDLVL